MMAAVSGVFGSMYGESPLSWPAAIAIVLAGLAVATPLRAGEHPNLAAAVDQFADPEAALDLEERIVDLVRAKDRTGVQRLAEQIDDKDASALTAIGHVIDDAEGAASANAPDAARLALSLGPCHYANVLVREVAFLIAEDGTEAVERGGVVEVADTDVDDLYAEMMRDCRRIKGLPERASGIGRLAR